VLYDALYNLDIIKLVLKHVQFQCRLSFWSISVQCISFL